jgi:hypothetical protein
VRADVTFTLDSYDVVKEIYPTDIDQYDGLLISGSRSAPSFISLDIIPDPVIADTSPNEDIPWVQKLRAYAKNILAEKPSLKIFGN